MEGQIAEQAQIVQMSISSIITIASGIVVTLSGVIAILFRMLEKKNDYILVEKEKDTKIVIELTKSYMETTIGVKTALENNTKVIERLAGK